MHDSLWFILVIWTPIQERGIIGFDHCPAFYWGVAYVIPTFQKNGDWVIKGPLI